MKLNLQILESTNITRCNEILEQGIFSPLDIKFREINLLDMVIFNKLGRVYQLHINLSTGGISPRRITFDLEFGGPIRICQSRLDQRYTRISIETVANGLRKTRNGFKYNNSRTIFAHDLSRIIPTEASNVEHETAFG